MIFKYIYIVFLFLVCVSCIDKTSEQENTTATEKLFKKLDASETGISFSNNLKENDTLNYFTYSYLYMGGGVAAGDINNDGLIDLYFTGNQVSNKLYLNKGGLKFEDITENAGVGGDDRWFTGVTMADVDGDGFLDIYCSVGGLFAPKENLFFHNNGDGTFTEKAKEFGIADKGNSVNGTFFDYDLDGDLDLYVANYPPTPFSTPPEIYKYKMRNTQDVETDKLFRNENGTKFTDVTDEAGLRSFGLSLSATVSDLNDDGWPDIYVSNDFSTPDYLFLNQKDGTFKEHVKEATKNTSFYGMGVDIADFNNDTLLDFFQVDMSPNDNRRSKANMASMNPELFYSIVDAGFHHQYMQNSLQLNTGALHNEVPDYSNIARLAGVASTDWSWAPLFSDLDNDGWKDLFIANGTRKEINNRDYFAKLGKSKNGQDSLLYKSDRIPSERVDNFVFRNQKDLTFKQTNEDWGLQFEGFSNGSIYADLDNDGDLELVVNNIDDQVAVFENMNSFSHHYLQVKLEGSDKNTFGLGGKVLLKTKEGSQYQELTLSRGFQSSVAPILHFGVGNQTAIHTLEVTWPNGAKQTLNDVGTDQLLTLRQKDAAYRETPKAASLITDAKLFETVSDSVLSNYRHKENLYDDYKKEILLPHSTSRLGPGLAVGDLNGDGRDDFFVGGAANFTAGLFYQKENGFEAQQVKALQEDSRHEDMGALIFDADNDGDQDLYVVSGGNEFEYNSKYLQDRLYVNDGKGNLTKAIGALPKMITSGSRVYQVDYDKDGDQDLLVCGRLIPQNYPIPADSYLLENVGSKGRPKFIDVTEKSAPDLKKLGLATSAVWVDYDLDGWQDLVVVGEWMPITVFHNDEGELEDVTEDLGLEDTRGWWFSIAKGDFDKDGDEDLIIGNLGLNYKYQATSKETFDVYLNDFDKNRRNDIVLSYYNGGKKYPVRGRECSSQQVPEIKKKFLDYNSFSTATLEDVYGEKKLENSLHYQVKSFASIYLENTNGNFTMKELPMEAQFSSVNQILVQDFNEDGKLDAIIAGNLYEAEVETPRNDASIGLLLENTAENGFTSVNTATSGFYTKGDVKDMAFITIKGRQHVIVAKNNDTLQLIRVNK